MRVAGGGQVQQGLDSRSEGGPAGDTDRTSCANQKRPRQPRCSAVLRTHLRFGVNEKLVPGTFFLALLLSPRSPRAPRKCPKASGMTTPAPLSPELHPVPKNDGRAPRPS